LKKPDPEGLHSSAPASALLQVIGAQNRKIETLSEEVSRLNEENSHLNEENSHLNEENSHLNEENSYLSDEVKRLRAELYGRSTERHTESQDFDEKEQPAAEEIEEEQENVDADADSSEFKTISYTRKKKGGQSGRRPLPPYLNRVRIEYPLPESELVAPEGFEYVKIGEVITETLEVTPATVHVIQHVRFQYACREREEYGVKIAPVPEQVIPKSIASVGLLAHVLVQKYCYHLPFYRQERIWADLEVNLPRNTLCTWAMKCAALLEPLREILRQEILADGYVHADETPVSVQVHEKKKKGGEVKKSEGPEIENAYMWVYLNPMKPLVLYDYQEGRAGSHPLDFFEGFEGYVQADAYSGYNCIESEKIKRMGCMAHARRKFAEIVKRQIKHAYANAALCQFKALYQVEEEIRIQKRKDLAADRPIDYEAIKRRREEEALPLLQKLNAWLTELQPKAPPKGPLGKAVAYSLNHWQRLIRYLEDGRLNIDNNPVENAIRPFALGRKNWLFCGNHEGARAAALIYSLIESAKANHLKPFEYLKYVLTHIKSATTEAALLKLLPHHAKLDPSLDLHYKAPTPPA
jgi:transposase